MSTIHLIDHADLGQLRIEDPRYVRVDREAKAEFYVVIVDGSLEQNTYSVHETAADAERTAAALGRRLRCDWGTSYRRRERRIRKLAFGNRSWRWLGLTV